MTTEAMFCLLCRGALPTDTSKMDWYTQHLENVHTVYFHLDLFMALTFVDEEKVEGLTKYIKSIAKIDKGGDQDAVVEIISKKVEHKKINNSVVPQRSVLKRKRLEDDKPSSPKIMRTISPVPIENLQTKSPLPIDNKQSNLGGKSAINVKSDNIQINKVVEADSPENKEDLDSSETDYAGPFRCTECGWENDHAKDIHADRAVMHWSEFHGDVLKMEMEDIPSEELVTVQELFKFVVKCSMPDCVSVFGSSISGVDCVEKIKTHWAKKHAHVPNISDSLKYFDLVNISSSEVDDEEVKAKTKEKDDINKQKSDYLEKAPADNELEELDDINTNMLKSVIDESIDDGPFKCSIGDCDAIIDSDGEGWKEECINHFSDKHKDEDLKLFKYVDFLTSRSIGMAQLFKDAAQCRYLGCRHIVGKNGKDSKNEIKISFDKHFSLVHSFATVTVAATYAFIVKDNQLQNCERKDEAVKIQNCEGTEEAEQTIKEADNLEEKINQIKRSLQKQIVDNYSETKVKKEALESRSEIKVKQEASESRSEIKIKQEVFENSKMGDNMASMQKNKIIEEDKRSKTPLNVSKTISKITKLKCRVDIKKIKTEFMFQDTESIRKTSVKLESESSTKPKGESESTTKPKESKSVKENGREGMNQSFPNGLKCTLCPESNQKLIIRSPAVHWRSFHPEQTITSVRFIRVGDNKILNLNFFYKIILRCTEGACGFITVANRQPNDARNQMKKHVKKDHAGQKGDLKVEEVKQLGYKCLAEGCLEAPADRNEMIDHHVRQHGDVKDVKSREMDTDQVKDLGELFKVVSDCGLKCGKVFYGDTREKVEKDKVRHRCGDHSEIGENVNKDLEKLVAEDLDNFGEEELEELNEEDIKAVTRILDQL